MSQNISLDDMTLYYTGLTNTESETNEEVVITIKPRMRKKPMPAEYFRNYYRLKLCEPYTCELCGKTLSQSSKIKRHQESNKCLKSRNTE